MAITKTEQKWYVGNTVQAGFVKGEIIDGPIQRKDLLPDIYVVRGKNGQLYTFIPHNGVRRLSESQYSELIHEGKLYNYKEPNMIKSQAARPVDTRPVAEVAKPKKQRGRPKKQVVEAKPVVAKPAVVRPVPVTQASQQLDDLQETLFLRPHTVSDQNGRIYTLVPVGQIPTAQRKQSR